MKTRLVVPVLAALLAGAVAALAANNTFFTSLGDLVFPFGPPSPTGAGGSIGDVNRGGMAPVNGNLSYAKVVPLTGFSATFGNFQQELLLKPAGTLAAGYVTMAPQPIDGGKACVFSTQTITALSVSANTGQTIADAVTTLAANARACYLYSKGDAVWNRSQ